MKKIFIKKIEIKVWVLLLLLIMGLYCFSHVQYSQRYNIIIENRSDAIVNAISFQPGGNSTEKMEVTHIAAQERIKISRDFEKAGENFIALIDTPKETGKVIPLAYIYSPNSVNIVKIIIQDTKGGKITKLTVYSYNNGFSVIPGWIRSLYDYEEVNYDALE